EPTTINPPLAVTKRAVDLSGAPLYPGDGIEYRIATTNTSGIHTQSNVLVSDPVPTDTMLVTGSVVCSPRAACGVSGSVVTSTIDSLGPGEIVTLTFRVTTEGDTGGQTITNQAYVSSDQQPVPTQPPSTTLVVTTSVPALGLSKWTEPNASSSPDGWTRYHFRVINTGDVTLTNIQVWDSQLSPRIGPFNSPDLSVGETYTIRRWWPTYGVDVTNVATATAQAPGFPRSVSASDDEYFDFIGRMNLALDVSADPDAITTTQLVTYTYRLSNTGDDWWEGGVITDTVYGDIAGGLSLAPGDSYTRVLTRPVVTTTVNTAYARGTDRLGTTATVTDTTTVTVGTGGSNIFLPLVLKDY
ncbi:MAG: hypothetical protein PVH62_04835, partial [Anaerolineae bacterium]